MEQSVPFTWGDAYIDELKGFEKRGIISSLHYEKGVISFSDKKGEAHSYTINTSGKLKETIWQLDWGNVNVKHPTPTFDDLIDVTIKAQKDGLIHKVEIISRGSIYVSEKPTSKVVHFNLTSINEGIIFINSLYTKTFVIEDNSHVLNCNGGDEIIFPNGVKGEFSEAYDHSAGVLFLDSGLGFIIPFELFKGATVTQKRDK